MITVTVKACLQGGRWPQVGGVTRLSISSLILTWSRLHDRWEDYIRDYMDRRVTSLTWGPPPPRKQALSLYELEPGNLVADKADTATAIKR